jgi:hypothetical protein
VTTEPTELVIRFQSVIKVSVNRHKYDGYERFISICLKDKYFLTSIGFEICNSTT